MAKANNIRPQRQYLIGSLAIIREPAPGAAGGFRLSRFWATEGSIVPDDVPNILFGSAPFEVFDAVVGFAEILVVDLLIREWLANKRCGYQPMDTKPLSYSSLEQRNTEVAFAVRPLGKHMAASVSDVPK